MATNIYPYNCSAKLTYITTINIFKDIFAVSLSVAVTPDAVSKCEQRVRPRIFFINY